MALGTMAGNMITRQAGADLSSTAQHSLVIAHSTEGQCVVATANTDKPLGTLQNQPESGEEAIIRPLRTGEDIPMVASAAINLNAEVAAITGGKIVTGDGGSGDTIIGTAAQAATDDLDVILVHINVGQTQE